MSPLSVLFFGLVLGLRHATDPDHVVAMGTIVARDPHVGRAIRTGLLWGIGHSATVMVVGTVMLMTGVRVPDRATTAMELAVAAMLVGMGAAALAGTFDATAVARLPERLAASRLRPLLVGVVHGLAGSAALALLAMASIREAHAALLYLALFGTGTVAGMMLVTMALAFSLRWVGSTRATVSSWLVRGSGVLSIAAGVGALVQQLL